jgi:hypothetical protein
MLGAACAIVFSLTHSLTLSTPTSFEYEPLLPGATNASSSILLLCDIFGYGVIPAGPVHNVTQQYRSTGGAVKLGYCM